MNNYNNSSIIYVSQLYGDDNLFNGLVPDAGEYGNGPFKTLKRALADVGQRRISGSMRPIIIMLTDAIKIKINNKPKNLNGASTGKETLLCACNGFSLEFNFN